MLIVRPVDIKDLAALKGLLRETGIGMTSLPQDEDLLSQKISLSLSSFAKPPNAGKPREALFFFVLENTETGELAGTAAIKSGIGLGDPFYSYRLDKAVHASSALGVHKVMPTLYLSNDYTGAAELASLFLAPKYRHGGNAHLLSKSRFLFLAQYAERFPETLIADMRGVSDEQGRSPFWDALGQHFFSMDFPLADRLSGSRSKSFIAELMPRHPIYVPLLPPEAQAVIGQVHEKTKPARELLEREGFRHKGYVDIFDAGPTLEANLRDIRAVRESRMCNISTMTSTGSATDVLLANTSWDSFRCAIATVPNDAEQVCVNPQLMERLGLQNGEQLRIVATKPTATKRSGSA